MGRKVQRPRTWRIVKGWHDYLVRHLDPLLKGRQEHGQPQRLPSCQFATRWRSQHASAAGSPSRPTIVSGDSDVRVGHAQVVRCRAYHTAPANPGLFAYDGPRVQPQSEPVLAHSGRPLVVDPHVPEQRALPAPAVCVWRHAHVPEPAVSATVPRLWLEPRWRGLYALAARTVAHKRLPHIVPVPVEPR
jgi:hypothetical protein